MSFVRIKVGWHWHSVPMQDAADSLRYAFAAGGRRQGKTEQARNAAGNARATRKGDEFTLRRNADGSYGPELEVLR